jgi:hypothetical protein
MSCREQQRLFDEYYNKVSEYFAAVNHSTDARGWSSTYGTQVRSASIAVEQARSALEKHEQNHRCGRVFNVDRVEQFHRGRL